MLIVIRMLLMDVATQRTLRVVHTEPGRYWLHEIGDKGWPVPMPAEMVNGGLEDGTWVCKAEDALPIAKTKAAQERHAVRYAIAEPLLRPEVYGLLMGSGRFNLIKERVGELARSGTKTSYQQISILLHNFWDRGMTRDALATAYDHCGAPGKQRNNSKAKVGRPRTIAPEGETPKKGINVTEGIEKQLQVAANMHLKGGHTVGAAYRAICRLFYTIEDESPENAGRVVLSDERPSVGQLVYYLRTHYPAHVRRRLRRGERNHALNDRAVTGRADSDVFSPGDRYEIDATVADAYLVSAFDPTRIVGRPVIYTVVDVYSRLIVATYVGFEGPSWIGAMMALVNMVQDKVEFCAQYDIKIGPDEWPCQHAPVEIMADRGELMSVPLGHNIVEKLQIGIANTRAYRGDMKGIVERLHRRLQSDWGHFNPGYVKADFGERGAVDYRQKGATTLWEFTRQHLLAVLVHNSDVPQAKEATPEMTSAGLTAAPIDYWNFGVSNLGPRLHKLTVDQVAYAVMPQAEARVYPNGIKFKGAYYDCGRAHREEWFVKARTEGTWTVKVSYDPRDLGRLYLLTDDNILQILDVLPADRDIRMGKSLFEVEEQSQRAKGNVAASAEERTAIRMMREEEMRKVGKNATKRLDAALKAAPPKAKRTKGIRSNHAEEKLAQRKVERIVIGPAETKEPSSPPRQGPPASRERSEMDRIASLMRRKSS